MLKRNLKRSQGRILAVLDIGTSKVGCLIARAEPFVGHPAHLPTVQVLGLATLASHGVKAGTIFDLDAAEHAVRATIEKASRDAEVPIEALTVAVACGRLQSRRFTARTNIGSRTIVAADLEKVRQAAVRYLRRDNRNIVDMVELDYQIDGTKGIRAPLGMTGQQLGVTLHAVTADDADLRHLLLMTERCHLRTEAVAVAARASALSTTSEEERQLGITCIDIGDGTILIASFQDGRFVWTDMLPMGGTNLTFAIARALELPLAEAERIKTLYGTVSRPASDDHQLIALPRGDGAKAYQTTRAELRTVLQPRVEAMICAIGDRLGEAVAKGGVSRHAASRIVLTGGTSELTGLAGFAAGLLRRQVRIGRPLLLPGAPTDLAKPSLATLSGLLLFALSSQRVGSGVFEAMVEPPDYFGRVRQWIKESF